MTVPPRSGVCPGPLTRRDLLRAGTLGPLGLGLTALTAHARPEKPQAKACILLFMWGGPSHLDTWDLKPDAPDEVRGPFKPIATTVPGLRICEHFPRLATLAHKYAVVRSMTHDDPAHLSSVHHLMTGHLAPKPKSDADPPSRNDWPHVGSVLARQRPGGALPPFVSLPWAVSHPAAPGGVAPGQHAGWLGAGFDPFLITGDPNAPGFRVGGLAGPADVPADRFAGRDRLLASLDAAPADEFAAARRKALSLLTSRQSEAAFDLSREPAAVRDEYGRHPHGQSCLLARRLVEAGVRLVCVNWPDDRQTFWDTHGNNFNGLKTRLMPPADQGFAALLTDLGRRGMLDETLVVWVGEFGRAPVISKASAGREHWPRCYSAVLAGGGIRGGAVYGASDRIGGMPKADPVTPADLTATVYHALGVDPGALVEDRLGRPLPLAAGVPLRGLFG
ncbi:MAG: DUF1501 domain-containing protein [Gemmataceae bacterium]